MSKTLNQMLKPHKDGYYPKAGDEQKFVDKHVVTKVKHLGGKATEDDKLFQATNIKTGKREEEHGYDADKSDQKVYEETKKKKPSLTKKITKKAIAAMLGKQYNYLTQNTQQDTDNNMNKLNESVAKDLYKTHHERVKELLKGINQGLEMHKKACSTHCDYGHVGDMRNLANNLQDIHDQLHMQGEYAKPPKPVMREGVEQIDEKKLTFAQFMIEAMGSRVTLHVKPHPDKKGHHVIVKSSDPERFKTGDTVPREELEQGQDDGYLKVTHVKD